MNYLAHIYLSGNDRKLQLGNFIADSVRGKQIANYSGAVKDGILLHREIDRFTDDHAVFRRSCDRLRSICGKYSGVAMDVVYDHFLAAGWKNYHSQELADYVQSFYTYIEEVWEQLPERVQYFFPYMKQYNWLEAYQSPEGTAIILNQMSERAQFDSGMEKVGAFLEQEYEILKGDFDEFFPDIQQFVSEHLK